MLEDLERSLEDLPPRLRRAAVYRGIAREIGGLAFSLAVWPIGLLDEAVRIGAGRLPRRRRHFPDPPTSAAAAVPVLLVHGYFHNRSAFMLMGRSLRRHGFKWVSAFNYNPMRKGIPELAEEVACKVDQLIAESGASKVHIVGHSLGGLLGRYFVEQLGGQDRVHTLVTLGTPHYGTYAAYLARSVTAKQMRPGSPLMNEMARADQPRRVRYFSYYCNLDALVVPSESAVLDCEDGRVRNILVHDHGHLSLLLSQELVDSIAENLSDLNSSSGTIRRSEPPRSR